MNVSRYVAALAVAWLSSAPALTATFPWLSGRTETDSVATRIPPPAGYSRLEQDPGAFGAWLRELPLRPVGTTVRLFDGRAKDSQRGVFAVVDIDVGGRDLQQCADAVIRLRAEYLRQTRCAEQIAFNFTSGHPARWSDWATGRRPAVAGSRVSWVGKAAPDGSYSSFRSYLDTVFMYAGSASLARELTPVADPTSVLPGDVFIQGGFPGHAVLIVDVVEDTSGHRVFLLAQSYMPAQDIHILKNPKGLAEQNPTETNETTLSAGESPWYPARKNGELLTPEWRFEYTDLRRFPAGDCGLPEAEPGARNGSDVSGSAGESGK